jgi:hypothetical protein
MAGSCTAIFSNRATLVNFEHVNLAGALFWLTPGSTVGEDMKLNPRCQANEKTDTEELLSLHRTVSLVTGVAASAAWSLYVQTLIA